jgi:energy-coupling factor transporter ATP-binding protein EcfA2
MYQSHFGLRESPFNITPNPAFFYSGNARGDILEALLYAVGHGEGIIKVTGEVGAGKTMLCRMLESRMPPHIDVIYLVNQPQSAGSAARHRRRAGPADQRLARRRGPAQPACRTDRPPQRRPPGGAAGRGSASHAARHAGSDPPAHQLETARSKLLQSCCSASPSWTSTWNWPACAS